MMQTLLMMTKIVRMVRQTSLWKSTHLTDSTTTVSSRRYRASRQSTIKKQQGQKWKLVSVKTCPLSLRYLTLLPSRWHIGRRKLSSSRSTRPSGRRSEMRRQRRSGSSCESKRESCHSSQGFYPLSRANICPLATRDPSQGTTSRSIATLRRKMKIKRSAYQSCD